MTPRDKKLHEQLQDDLKLLKLTTILEQYSDVLDEAARKNRSMLEVLCLLVGAEATSRLERALRPPSASSKNSSQIPTTQRSRGSFARADIVTWWR